MNKHIIQMPLLIIALLVMSGCTKQNLMTYNQSSLGSSIYFAERKQVGSSSFSTPITTRDIAFGYVGVNITDSVVVIPVGVTGYPDSIDRAFAIKIADTSTLKQGVDFDFYQPPIIHAGRVLDTLKIILHRTAALKDTSQHFHLDMQLTANENFNTNLPWYYTSNDSISILNYTITASDYAPQSFLWTDSRYKAMASAILGTYSLAKVQLMEAVLQLPPDTFFPANPASVVLSPALVMGWGTYMKNWLAAEQAAGRTYYDEFGNVITMGAAA